MNIERLKQHLIALCRVPSVSGSDGEADMPAVIVQRISMIPYFKEHKEDLHLYAMDKGGFVFALKRSSKPCRKTILLLSHFDVVDVEEYGIGRAFAFDPEAYTDFLKQGNVMLDEEARDDLHHGYLFGRGVCDMKWGIAADIECMHYYDEHPLEQQANILFVSVPDEERNSAGMCAAAKQLNKFREEEQLDITSCIVSEPDISPDKSSNKRIFTGAAGKIMPLIYCVGKETHVGDPYFGLNPNLLTSAITSMMELSYEFIDQANGYYTPAPTCLKQSDLKGEYSVQTPYDAWCYFNLMTITKTPDIIMKQIRSLCEKAFQRVLEERQNMYEKARAMIGKDVPCAQFQVKVMTYQELYEVCVREHGDAFIDHMRKFKEKLSDGDLREMSLKMIQETHNFCSDRDPKIILSFAPPYYPHTGFIDEHSELIQACKTLCEEGATQGESFEINYCFNGLTDMSYLSLREPVDIDSLTRNFPLWGKQYQVPLHDIRELNIPFVNFGPLGKDPHKFSERIDQEYSFGKAPQLLLRLTKLLSK